MARGRPARVSGSSVRRVPLDGLHEVQVLVLLLARRRAAGLEARRARDRGAAAAGPGSRRGVTGLSRLLARDLDVEREAGLGIGPEMSMVSMVVSGKPRAGSAPRRRLVLRCGGRRAPPARRAGPRPSSRRARSGGVRLMGMGRRSWVSPCTRDGPVGARVPDPHAVPGWPCRSRSRRRSRAGRSARRPARRTRGASGTCRSRACSGRPPRAAREPERSAPSAYPW